MMNERFFMQLLQLAASHQEYNVKKSFSAFGICDKHASVCIAEFLCIHLVVGYSN